MILRQVRGWRKERGRTRNGERRSGYAFIITLECGHELREFESRGVPSNRPRHYTACEMEETARKGVIR